MASKFDELLPMIVNAGDSGLSAAKITTKFAGKSQAKQRATELRDKLDALVRDGAIWGPLKFRTSRLYFPTGRGPSIETASAAIVDLILRSGVKLRSKAGLKEKATGHTARS